MKNENDSERTEFLFPVMEKPLDGSNTTFGFHDFATASLHGNIKHHRIRGCAGNVYRLLANDYE